VGEKEEVTRPRRVVLDTNVVVSALLFRDGRLSWLREAWEAGRFVPMVSAETIAELARVLGYPRFKLSGDEAKNLLAAYMEQAEAVGEVRRSVRIPKCRDEDDRAFLRLAYAARADVLVTGDKDLLAVAAASRIPVLAPEAFRRMLEL
jgi:putative PIN family toxin of toxin-antitoxin system